MPKTKKRVGPGGMEIVDTRDQQLAALAVVDDLHERGFTRVWLESVRVFSGGRLDGSKDPQVQHYHLRVVIDEVEIHSDKISDVLEVASKNTASVNLTSVHMNQQEFSRITLWPKVNG